MNHNVECEVCAHMNAQKTTPPAEVYCTSEGMWVCRKARCIEKAIKTLRERYPGEKIEIKLPKPKNELGDAKIEWSCTEPCATCPYRKEAQLGFWDREEFELLLANERTTLGTIYLCHSTRKLPTKKPCAGWLATQKKTNIPSNMLRLSLVRNPEALKCFNKIDENQEGLYESVEEMCAANGVAPEES